MWPKPLLLATEAGYHALVGVRPVDILSWTDFKQVCRQLKKPEAKAAYETIILDTITLLYRMCEKYILQREGISQIGDISYGRGWDMLKEEFEDTLRELTQLGYALVFIAHSKNRATEYTDENGAPLTAYAPDMPNACYQICNRMVDIIAYVGVEYDLKTGKSFRYLYTRGTPTIFAGSRYKYLKPRIELSYQNLVDAVAEAMEKEANETGTRVISKDELVSYNVASRPFEETMEEAKKLWSQIITTKGDEGREAIKNIITEVFGREIQLSRATPDQQEMVEMVIEGFKRL